ncbi:MAG TPA: esterase-like activity of phytase family protein [Blastocatellia bacterium]|nr:esterase-like activity of phytase family protein [Blastocatellia bacterium]
MKLKFTPFHQNVVRALRSLGAIMLLVIGASVPWGQEAVRSNSNGQTGGGNQLVGRAVLDAATFAPGTTSGERLGTTPINGQPVPFINKQPIQGFSAVLDNGNGTYSVMSDNGYGSLENSADYKLRVYTICPDFKTRTGGSGKISVLSHIELHDPDRRIPFTITNQFTNDRVLTGADFDIESLQRAPDGTLWFGDEFGPFLLHTSARGRVLEAPIPLPDFDQGGEIRSPQNPFNEEAGAVRIMNAARAHARLQGNFRTPVFSPWELMLADNNPATFVDHRQAPPAGSGLKPAASEVFNVQSIKNAGYPVVVWTVDDKARMLELMRLGVNGIISDRPDLLRQAVEEFDANGDGTPGDFITAEGLIDLNRFDAQGHRGGRDLRPENTLPAMEVALDNLVSTLELDTGITSDRVPVVDHDPHLQAQKCRRADGEPYSEAGELLIKDLTAAEIQSRFICDKVFRGPDQTNDPKLSPTAVAFAQSRELIDPYVMPTLQQIFDFVKFYAEYYRTGPGSSHPDAVNRWRNAERIRFNIETKVNPRAEFARRTIGPRTFAGIVARVIKANGLQNRADIQSFDFRTLLEVQRRFPEIRTVYLFGDFPVFADTSVAGSDDGTNLQDENGKNSPWLAGMFWPYRSTVLDHPARARQSGGFEGMALTDGGKKLMPLLEQPLVGGEEKTLLIHEFDLARRKYTGKRFKYVLDQRGTNIGDFIMYDKNHGLVIERDATQGDLNGFKAIYRIELGAPGQPARKTLLVDLMKINDPHQLSLPGLAGDLGLGPIFAFPFVTIEDVIILDRWHIGVINDNNFPTSIGRHLGSGRPDDNEFIVIRLANPLK